MAYKRSAPSPFLMPILLVVVLAGAMVAVTLMNKQDAQAAAEEPEAPPSPFDDLPDEEPPVRSTGSGARSTSKKDVTAPDLSTNPHAQDETFAAWVEKTAEAETLFQQAVEALEAGEHGAFHKKGRDAKKVFEEAIEKTAAYEESLVAEHGDVDEAVRGIVRLRNFWEERRLFLHKMTR